MNIVEIPDLIGISIPQGSVGYNLSYLVVTGI